MKFLIIAGGIIFLGSIGLILSNLNALKVEKQGQIVLMKIESLPASCIGARVRYFVTYSYQGMLFEKATRGDFCEKHHVGEMIPMKYLPESNSILRPDESVVKNLLAFGLLGLFGLVVSLTQLRKYLQFSKVN